MEIIVIIPCFNEEITIAKVVGDFRTELPEAQICVIDNNSTDRSVEKAAAAGALVKRNAVRAKGTCCSRPLIRRLQPQPQA